MSTNASKATTELDGAANANSSNFKNSGLFKSLNQVLEDLKRRPEGFDPADASHRVLEVAQSFLCGYASPHTTRAWADLMEEIIPLTEGLLALIQMMFATQSPSIYHYMRDSVKIVFCRLVDIGYTLGLWMDVVEPDDEIQPSPGKLRNSVLEVLAEVLSGLPKPFPRLPAPARSISSDQFAEAQKFQNPEALKVLREMVNEVVELTDIVQLYLGTERRLLVESARRVFDYILSPSCHFTNDRRIRWLGKLFQVVLETLSDTGPLFSYMQERLLHSRYDGTIHGNTTTLDVLLNQSFDRPFSTASRAVVYQALGCLNASPNDERNPQVHTLAISYLKHSLSGIDKELLPLVLKHLQATLGHAIEPPRTLIKATQPKPSAGSTQARMNLKDHVWRRQVQELVQAIISPDSITWMDDDFRPNEPYTLRRILADVAERFSRPLSQADDESRIKLARNLAKLPCLLVVCTGESCTTFRNASGPSLLGFYVPILQALLAGPADEVTPSVRREVYSVLLPVLKHRNEEEPDEPVLEMITRGVTDDDRAVRVQAGLTLQAVVEFYSGNTLASRQNIENFFHRLYQVFEGCRHSIKETLLISVGSLGKTANPFILGSTLCLLILQLGQSNLLLHSLACTQLLNISRHHKKSIYSLLSPHFDRVVKIVFERLSTQPTLLTELCRLMQLNIEEFISRHHAKALPDVLLRCDMKGVDLIAHSLGKNRSTTILDSLDKILVPILLLPTVPQTNKAVAFLIGIFNEDSRDAKISLQTILPGHTTSVLTELVIRMGVDDPQSRHQALNAVKKVETALQKGTISISQKANPSEFLATQMLGIMSKIIDTLQDVHGKKSVEAKEQIIRSIGVFISLVGPPIHSLSSQIMAIFQTSLSVAELAEVTLESWHEYLVTIDSKDLGPHLGSTCSAFVSAWPNLSDRARKIIVESLQLAFGRLKDDLIHYLDDLPDLSIIDDLKPLHFHLSQLRHPLPPRDSLEKLLDRCSSSNLTIATLALEELKRFMQTGDPALLHELLEDDMFDPMIGRLISTVYSAAARDGDLTESLRLVAYECIGILGALDPYRFQLPARRADTIVLRNFTDENETYQFIINLIEELVDAFRSTSDMKFQTNLAYPIQELLKLCGFTSDLVNSGRAVPLRTRNRWAGLKKEVMNAVTPLLEGRFSFSNTVPAVKLPVYPTQSTYREWLQLWVTHLISRVSGDSARKIFGVFQSVVRSKDVVLATHLLPHLILNILISGEPDDAEDIRTEIRIVLEDQVDPSSTSTHDKKILSAQAIFTLLDHLNRWAHIMRREITTKQKSETKRARASVALGESQEQLLRLDSILSNLDKHLVAKAAFQCKAYARALMNFEQQIHALKELDNNKNLEPYYDTIHEIYAHLDQPDGMEGITALIQSPSLEHQIREHESIGQWTSAQSCWEVRLQESPDNLEYHQGLLRCLRNLGHYDTLRNHVKGILTSHPEWQADVIDFHTETLLMVGAWDDVEALVNTADSTSVPVMMAKVMLAMRKGDPQAISDALSLARLTLGAPISAAGVNGYARSYEAALSLHHLYELELIHNTTRNLPSSSTRRKQALTRLSSILADRLENVLPTFRNLEPILSTRRIGFSLMPGTSPDLVKEVGKAWLSSAKVARKAGHWPTAYSAILQARQSGTPLWFLESAKLMKASGDFIMKAVRELESHMQSLGLISSGNVLDLTLDDEVVNTKHKLFLWRARWMSESGRFDGTPLLEAFKRATELDKRWESSHFYFGNFYDASAKDLKPTDARRLKMNMHMLRNYSRATRYGTKFIYQTIPRLLTVWLDNGEDKNIFGTDVFNKMNEVVASAIKDIPAYKWFTAFPQIVSRVCHPVDKVYNLVSQLIVSIIQEYPDQALWLFAGVIKSTKHNRLTRGRVILEKAKSSPSSSARISRLISDLHVMANEMLALCEYPVSKEHSLSMPKLFPRLKAIGECSLLIPLLVSLTVSLPSSSSAAGTHQPFPDDAPTFKEFSDEIDVMRSMARPRKIWITGSDGGEYIMLIKPKDDLRKDARLMDFDTIINRLLKANADARRRKLYIRTYAVVPLNEECGCIEWVQNTSPLRPILFKYYEARRIKTWTAELEAQCNKIKDAQAADAGNIFVKKILPMFPPVFHQWFIETFPDPSAWLENRTNYARTAAVMSIVGWILGLGDRHCENILLDVITGDAVHIDFNCLFEKGKVLLTPERVPFRLTQNIVDGLGVTGVEGMFRIACELTMDLLRNNMDSLMSVLDAFIHDPLVEWEDEKRKQENRSRRSAQQVPVTTTNIAKNALNDIKKKLEGRFTPYTDSQFEQPEKLLSTKNLVEALINEASNPMNLSKMYPGWAPWN
ncbi:atypical/PIKK/ATR protein kinase [Coprinopsis cinerea okayama7|uniref:non-specific serine/threonine protein kinase n=1 Tax=Coprinopsis cinerea (strain Okayama-7 / 130 / ATCC MYA-4618 / FGSC 9003) TaxID=240176 RepID=A8NZ06_COPC7|nr:atypical/PIKK/ATR protein kinase [Coprinopsis cinerea okayama7\|eukprot:XP_001837572.2 atypical/PIKK/ATR protein kinase [Coprinopsis cinerea okayama7\